MKKFLTTTVALSFSVVLGLVIRQVVLDLSDRADLWNSVTDAVD
ncbi:MULTISPECIES: DLW-39 family protein [unclassified Schaalia]|nr:MULTISPECIES: DLW-39 family protein [unclassified Schaalia]